MAANNATLALSAQAFFFRVLVLPAMLGSGKVRLPYVKSIYRRHRRQLPSLSTETLLAKHWFLNRSVSRLSLNCLFLRSQTGFA